jgi:hypothetical protein
MLDYRTLFFLGTCLICTGNNTDNFHEQAHRYYRGFNYIINSLAYTIERNLTMTEISRFKAVELIHVTKGRIFSCSFEKKDHTIRHMICQLPRPKENPKRAAPAKPNNPYILVRDMVVLKAALRDNQPQEVAYNAAYRLINLATLRTLTINKQHYVVI